MNLKIIADSCCDTTEDLRKELDIELVPLTILPPGGGEIIDDLALDTERLISIMAASAEPVRTACPSVGDYAKRMEKYEECVVITLSAKLSGSYNSARIARELVLEKHPHKKIAVFNSKTAAAGELSIALFVDTLKHCDASFEEIVEKTNNFISRMKTLFVLENVSNLVKNGRMSKVKGVIASVMSIHPVLSDDGNGDIKSLHIVRGLKNALNKMVDSIKELTENRAEKSAVLTLSYCNCHERALQLKEDILEKCKAIKTVVITPTAGISTVYANDGGIVVAF